MATQSWVFSVKLAWGNFWFRWIGLITIALVVLSSLLFFRNTIPLIGKADLFVLHYNVYLGIDALRSWSWIFLLPVIWFFVTLLDLIAAYVLYQRDRFVSWSLLILGIMWSLPWSAALFYLSLINR